MPELPEVEAICRRIRPLILRRKISSVEVLRPSVIKPLDPARFAELASGRTIRDVTRRGKNLLIDLSGNLIIRVHLGMTGELLVRSGAGAASKDRVVLGLGRRSLVFADTRALGVINLHTKEEITRILNKLGPEPLSDEFNLEAFIRAARRSSRPAKLFLTDQSHVAGLGNIYAAEALFRAGVNPFKPLRFLRVVKLEALHSAIVSSLRDAVQSTSSGYERPGRFREAEPFIRYVYRREGEPCLKCSHMIRRTEQAGRSTYFCPVCQR